MNYLKSLMYSFIGILSIGIILTLLYYFNIISNTVYDYLCLASIIICIFGSSVYLGKNSKAKGWLQGLKHGLLIIILLLFLNLIFVHSFSINSLVYYLLLLGTSMFGSMFGIRNVKVDK